MAERFAWRRLILEADDDFDSTELALASRIHNLFGHLAGGGGGGPDGEPPSPLVERAVRHGGRVYVLNYDPAHYESESNIIAVYRESEAMDLDDPSERRLSTARPHLGRAIAEVCESIWAEAFRARYCPGKVAGRREV